MLKIDGMTVSFGDNIVLNKASLEIQARSKCVIVGANGSGKTTLLKALLGLVDISCGSVLYNGKDLRESSRELDVSSNLPECYRFLPISCNDLVSAYGLIKGFDGNDLINRLRRFSLQEILEQKPWKLSTGQQKILFTLMAIGGNGGLVILDEPFENVDFERRKLLFDLVNGTDASVILSTHDLGILGIMREWRMYILVMGKLLGPLDPTMAGRYYFNRGSEEGAVYRVSIDEKSFSITVDHGEMPMTDIEKIGTMGRVI